MDLIFPKKAIFLPCQIKNKNVNGLLDTGSQSNIVSMEFFKSINVPVFPTTVKLIGINKKMLNVYGEIEFTTFIGDHQFPTTAYVAPDFKYDFLIGRELMEKAGIDILNSKKQVIVKNQIYTFFCDQDDQIPDTPRAFGYTRELIIIPARTRVIFNIEVRSNIPLQGYILPEILERKKLLNLDIQPAVYEACKSIIPISITNLSDEQVLLPKDMKVARILGIELKRLLPEVEEEVELFITHKSENADHFEKIVSHLDEPKRQEMRQLLGKFNNTISKHKFDVGRTNLVRHIIDTGNERPIKKNPYPSSFKIAQELKKMTDEMLTHGLIRQSISPWASPVVMVKKPDGSYRLCCDWRGLNAVTKKDSTPLPRIDDIFQRLHGAQYFTKIDLTSGFWQIEMDEQSREKTAFTTPHGLFEMNVMGMGLCNAPGTFQRLMNHVLGPLLFTCAFVYLDDILVYSSDWKSHLQDVEAVFTLLKKAGLKFKIEKSTFGVQKVIYLGHIISRKGISPDPEKIKAIAEFPVPKTTKQVRQFLGLAGYYRRFLRNFSIIAKPLSALTSIYEKFIMTPERLEAFERLKKALTSAGVTAHPNFNRPFILSTDASKLGLGAILKQRDDEGRERIIACASRSLNKHELNYPTTELELLAVVFGVTHFKIYIHGSKFSVITDHSALKALRTIKNAQGRLAKWAIQLSEYDFDIEYKPGKKHWDADALSRNPVLPPSYEDEEDILCLARKNEVFNFEEFSDVPPLYELIGENVSKLYEEQWAQQIIDYLLIPSGIMPKKAKSFKIENNRLYKKIITLEGTFWALVVPRSARQIVIRTFHENLANSHLGIFKTYEKAKTKYWFKGISSYVKNFVSTCEKCIKAKADQQKPLGHLQPLTPVKYPFARISMDTTGPLTTTNDGNRYILCVVDHCTRFIFLKAIVRNTQSEVIEFLQELITRYGKFDSILTDNGPEYTGEDVNNFLQEMKIRRILTTPYHPQSNGMVERLNASVKNMLALYVDLEHSDWDEFLKAVATAYNTSVHAVTGYSPFYLLHGFTYRNIFDPPFIENPNHMKQISHIQDDREHAAVRTLEEQMRQKAIHDEKHATGNFKIGDMVACENERRKNHPWETVKFKDRYSGPYVVAQKVGGNTYKIRNHREEKRVNVAKLKKWPTGNPKYPEGARIPPLDPFSDQFITNSAGLNRPPVAVANNRCRTTPKKISEDESTTESEVSNREMRSLQDRPSKDSRKRTKRHEIDSHQAPKNIKLPSTFHLRRGYYPPEASLASSHELRNLFN